MKNLVTSIWQFYVDGFRSMTLGRTLWLIIAIKLFIMFFIPVSYTHLTLPTT